MLQKITYLKREELNWAKPVKKGLTQASEEFENEMQKLKLFLIRIIIV